MVFNINEYTSSALSDIMVVVLFSFGIITALISSIKAINKSKDLAFEIIKIVFIVVALSFPIFSVYPSLANGEVTFLMEKDDEAQVVSGEIESICESSKLIPTYKYDHKFGADIVIDGVTYFAATAGELEVGDTVEVYYLENSKFILKINEK